MDCMPRPKDLLYWESGGMLFGWTRLHAFEAVLMMHFFCLAWVVWWAQGEGDLFLGSCRLWLLWVHGVACMRMNHINCWVTKNEYRKLGHQKPGLWTEDSLVFFFLCERTWIGRWAWLAKKVPCSTNSPLLISNLGSSHEQDSWLGQNDGWMGWYKGFRSGWCNMLMHGLQGWGFEN